MSRLKAENDTAYQGMDGCQALANAVVAQAAKDYRAALRRLKTNPDSQKAAAVKRECEKFFHSRWYTMLTGADPDYILNRIREEEAE